VDNARECSAGPPSVLGDREPPGTKEDIVKVDFPTLQSMAGRCRAEAADTTGRHASLSTSINASVLDGWTDSQAAARFAELYEQWRLAAQGVSDALTGMGDLLDSVASSYQQHETEMAARIGAML
jgi:WXG100 family type VII secretion target